MDERKQHTEAVEIGRRLQRAREAQGLTRTELAQQLGVHRSLLAYLETGQRAPSIYLAMDIINLLKISPQYLLWGSMQGIDGEVTAKLLAVTPAREKPVATRRPSPSGRTRRGQAAQDCRAS